MIQNQAKEVGRRLEKKYSTEFENNFYDCSEVFFFLFIQRFLFIIKIMHPKRLNLKHPRGIAD